MSTLVERNSTKGTLERGEEPKAALEMNPMPRAQMNAPARKVRYYRSVPFACMGKVLDSVISSYLTR
jgi:hypothetical protein